LPIVPGIDFVGRIYRISKTAAKKYQLNVGDRVLALAKWGGNSRFSHIDASELVRVPDSLDPAEATCLAETYLTTFQCLQTISPVGKRYTECSLKDKKVLVIGTMNTNLGRAFAQLAYFNDVQAIFATAKPKHYEYLLSNGVIPLSNDPAEWPKNLAQTVDLMIVLDDEPIEPLHKRCLKPNATIILIRSGDGVMEESKPPSNIRSKLAGLIKKANVTKTQVYDVFTEWELNTDKCKKDLVYLLSLLENKSIDPHVLDRIPLAKVGRAQEVLETKNLSGYLVCEPWLVTKCRAVAL
jgi:NADPH:quinone reductase-like Zn-dependent oxidoreductase